MIPRYFIALIVLASGLFGAQAKPNTQNKTTEIIDKEMTDINTSNTQFSRLDKLVAQKMTLDIRYFCEDEAKVKTPSLAKKHCWQGVTKLPAELAKMITDTNIGSVVLFAENFSTTEQVVNLTNDLQQAALMSSLGKPLIVSVDQEGGRVVRFAKATAFAGNMAIGATYDQHGTAFANKINHVIGKELSALGINNNYAPVVDVNTNRDNPVINTRSYGEKPHQVAKLGAVAVKALQEQGVMATLKHFPGHGDTHVDSHLGLPRVDHDLATIEEMDLLPFSEAIKQADPAMIMTAHIQYPALDHSTFISKSGEQHIRPATMSRKILHDLLRTEMKYQGLIATDALDMAGVAHYFDSVTATVETFVAGADLAVMPFKVRKPSDIERFKRFIKAVSQMVEHRIQQGEFSLEELEQSVARIDRYKSHFVNLPRLNEYRASLTQRIAAAKNIIAQQAHLAIEQALTNAATVNAKNNALLPLGKNAKLPENLYLVVESEQEKQALISAIEQQFLRAKLTVPTIHALVAQEPKSLSTMEENLALKKADLAIMTINVKTASLVDLGGIEDLSLSKSTQGKVKPSQFTYANLVEGQLEAAQQNQVDSILIARGSPYLMKRYTDLANAVLLTFDDRSYPTKDAVGSQAANSPGFNSSLAIIVGNQQANGTLPVSL